jgi:hypothetical protein
MKGDAENRNCETESSFPRHPCLSSEVDDQSQRPVFELPSMLRGGTATCLGLGISFLPM